MKPNLDAEMSQKETDFNESLLNILLVEDNPGDVFIIKDILETSGLKHKISHASRLSEAKQLLTENQFDVVLLDLGLPDSFGLNTLRALDESKINTAIIVLTGLDDEVVALASLKAGAQDYLFKNTISSHNILRAINYGIERKKIQLVQQRHAYQFLLLSQTNTAISECETIPLIYREICNRIKVLLENTIVLAVEIVDDEIARIIDSVGIEPYLEQIRFYTGSHLYQTDFRIDNKKQKVVELLQDEKLHSIEGGLFEVSLGNYTQEISAELEKMMGINHTYAISFLRSGKNYGGVIIFSKEQIQNDDKNIIETISSQAALNIHRRTVEKELRTSEKNFRELSEGLELIVSDRTRELAQTNNLLNDELEERKIIEEALRDSEKRYRSLIELSPEGVIVHTEGIIVYANSAALKLYGAVKFEQLNTQSVIEFIHPDDRFLIETRINQEFGGQVVPLIESRLLRLDGEILNVEVTGSRIIYQGKPSYQIIIRDITERKKREKELEKLDKILRAHNNSSHAMTHANDEISFLNEICQIVVNDCGHSMVWIGYSKENEDRSVKPMAYAGFEKGYLEKLKVTWADNERGRGPTGTAIRTGKLSECRDMLNDPTFKPWREEAIKRGYASSIAIPLISAGKAFGAITIYAREQNSFTEDEKNLFIDLANDLSYGIVAIRTQLARNKAEEQLFETKNYLENLISFANAPIIVWDPESKIRLFNKAFEFLTGYSQEEVIGKKLDFLFPKSNIKSTREKIEQTLSGDYWKSIEIPILCKNRKTRIVLWNSANIYDVDCKTLISTIAQGNDITEMKNAEEQLAKYASDLKDLNATKDKFFGIIAHDLKNPFSSILAASELLYSEPDKFEPEKIEKFSKILRDAAKSAYSLLENLLDWSRSQTGNIEFKPQNVSINELISSNLTQVKVHASNKNIKLLTNVVDEIQAFADKNMLNTVIRNLLNNAVKFTKKGGRVSINVHLNNKDLTLSVKDNGIGIPKKDIDKLFRIDTKYTNIGTANERGTGLGLLLCKEFVEKHGGEIWAESQVGKGSEFKFTIPIKSH